MYLVNQTGGWMRACRERNEDRGGSEMETQF